MPNVSFLRWALVGVIGLLMFSPVPSVEAMTCGWRAVQPSCAAAPVPSDATRVAERKGHTASDGPGQPYTDAGKKKSKSSMTPPRDTSNNRFICSQNCPFLDKDPRQEACIQKCLDRLYSRR